MFTSFSTALSALSAFSTAIDVVGNNLANLNTTGFKTSNISFHDLVTQSLGAGLGDTQVGFGVGTPMTQREFTQGAIQTTGGTLDAAIQGDGFFIVQGANSSTEYTRAGNFQVDQNGNLTTATGEPVQGWTQSNGVLNTNAPPGNITIPVGSVMPPVTTKNFSFDVNLNAAATAGNSRWDFRHLRNGLRFARQFAHRYRDIHREHHGRPMELFTQCSRTRTLPIRRLLRLPAP